MKWSKWVVVALRKAHRLQDGKDNDFDLRDQSEISNMASQVPGTMTLLLKAIAGVSLLIGVICILSGLDIAFGLGQAMGIRVSVNPLIILLSVGFTLAEGVSFGFYPARKAANLNPIEALRHE